MSETRDGKARLEKIERIVERVKAESDRLYAAWMIRRREENRAALLRSLQEDAQ